MFSTLVFLNSIIAMSFVNYFFSICDAKCSFRAFLAELKMWLIAALALASGLMVFSGVVWTESEYLLFLLLSSLFVASALDAKTGLISDNLNVFVFTVGAFYLYYSNPLDVFVENMFNAFVVIGLFSFLRFSSTIFFGREIIGEGDFIPLSLFVLIFGIKLGIFMLLFSFVLSIPAFAFGWMVHRRGDFELPFIPFISLSFLSGVLFEETAESLLALSVSVFF